LGKSLPKLLSLKEEIFACKDNGRYRERCVAKEFIQIPGKDFQEYNIRYNSTLDNGNQITFKLEIGQFDLETAFLYGKLEEDLWMYIPYGQPKYIQEKHGS
jgi:beta-lactamase superfamily II metal-dependent hydrolase